MARPEGSIAEAYVAAECLNFCSRYFDDDIETRHNREGRNRERVPVVKGDLSVFQHGVELLGAPNLTYLEHDYEKMVWFVLNNCPEVEPYIEIYKEELENEGCPNVPKTLEKQFSPWFKKHIAKLRYVENQDIDDELFALSCEPDLGFRIYSACLVNGVRFHTVDHDKNRRTQNSGVMTEGTHDNQDIDFYGSLKEIIELRYNSDDGGHRTVVLFRCDWFDTHGKKFRMKEDGFFRSVNQGRLWYRDDPFILAAQTTKIFYLLDTKYRENWRVVQKFSHRHLWTMAENDNGNIFDGMVLSYQDDDCEGVHVRVDASVFENEQPVCEDGVRVDASVVDDLRVQIQAEGEQDESSDSEDETGWQYVSDNEGPTIPLEDDNDSDYE